MTGRDSSQRRLTTTRGIKAELNELDALPTDQPVTIEQVRRVFSVLAAVRGPGPGPAAYPKLLRRAKQVYEKLTQPAGVQSTEVADEIERQRAVPRHRIKPKKAPRYEHDPTSAVGRPRNRVVQGPAGPIHVVSGGLPGSRRGR